VIQGEGCDELTELAKYLGYPVTNTLMGLGAFPGSDEQFLGMLGMHGLYEANMAMHNADVLLAVGARFDDRVTNTVSKFCPGAKIIHIDVDPAAISKTVTADIPIVGPVQGRPHGPYACSAHDAGVQRGRPARSQRRSSAGGSRSTSGAPNMDSGRAGATARASTSCPRR
jgi:hypothetical protein